MIDRETALQVAVSLGAVLVFIATAIFASATFGENGHLSEMGGFVLVGAIATFVLIIAIAGFWLSRQEFEESA